MWIEITVTLVKQFARRQFCNGVSRLVLGYPKLESNRAGTWQPAAIGRGEAQQVEPCLEQQRRQKLQLRVIDGSIVGSPPAVHRNLANSPKYFKAAAQ